MSSFACTIQMMLRRYIHIALKNKKKITIVDSFFSIACNNEILYVILHIYIDYKIFMLYILVVCYLF